jgi:hypothetical protein
MRSLFALVLGLAPAFAMACFVPPPHLLREHAALLDEATSVVLVEAERAPRGCRLRVLQTWKSTSTVPAHIRCRLPDEGDWMTDFNAHAEEEFWASRVGRLGIAGDCSLIPPAFAVGARYLLLLGVAPDQKQFEQLAAKDDRWLSYVSQRLGAGFPP